jgi:transcription antitermination factor NusG
MGDSQPLQIDTPVRLVANSSPVMGELHSGARSSETQGVGRWYVVHTQPHREQVAAWNLANQGFSVFLPQQIRTRRHARRIESVRAAYFPCYLFILLDLSRDRWRAINGTPGARRILARGHLPDPVQTGLVEQMMSCTDGNGLLRLGQDLQAGQPVEVIDGPFGDLIGTLDSLPASDRVQVLLDLMGAVRVTLPRNRVASVFR